MARFEAWFRSKKKEATEIPFIREFGGVEPQGVYYRLRTAKFPAKDDKEALRKANAIAKEKDMVLIKIIKFVWGKKNAFA